MDILNLTSLFDIVWPVFDFLFIDFKSDHDKGFLTRISQTCYTLKTDYFWRSYGRMKVLGFSSINLHPEF
jgi:hypothetical protein